MGNQNLLIFIDRINNGIDNNPKATNRWPWVYAHGEFEADYGFDIPLFNQDEPTYDGYFLATTEDNKTVVINLVADEYGSIKGRCCYIDDYEALKYVNSPQDWS